MLISPSQKRTLIAANNKINKLAQHSEKLNSYFQNEVIEDSFRTYRNIFHKIIIKIKLCFGVDEEKVFKLHEKKDFLEQLDISINKIKNEPRNQGSLIRAYTSNAEKSDVLTMFKDFFKGYSSCDVEVQGDYLNIYFIKDGALKSSFYLSMSIEVDTRNKFSPEPEKKVRKKRDILSSAHTSPLFKSKLEKQPELSTLKIESPRSDDSNEASESKKQVTIDERVEFNKSSSNLSVDQLTVSPPSPASSKHSVSTYETIPIEDYNRIDFEFLYAVKTNIKSYFANGVLLEKLEISDKNLLKLRNDIHMYSFLKKDHELKVVYIVYLLNLLTLKPEEIVKRRNEFIDGIYVLKAMQPNIMNVPIELNFSYWLMIENDFMPHTLTNLRKYFLIICTDRYLGEFLESLDETASLKL